MQVPVILIGPLVGGGGGGAAAQWGGLRGNLTRKCHNGNALSGNKLWHSTGSFLDAHRKIYGPQKGDYYFFTTVPPKKPKGPVRVRSQYGYSALLVSVPLCPLVSARGPVNAILTRNTCIFHAIFCIDLINM